VGDLGVGMAAMLVADGRQDSAEDTPGGNVNHPHTPECN